MPSLKYKISALGTPASLGSPLLMSNSAQAVDNQTLEDEGDDCLKTLKPKQAHLLRSRKHKEHYLS